MFNGDKEYRQDIFERVVHIEGKEDEINRKLDEQAAILDRILEKNYAAKSEADAFVTKSYAQYGEDVLIYNLFKKLGFENPTYIDIGAHHPYEISNTALFYMSGCRGTNVEANPNLIEAFYKERPDDRNICCGVGAENGEAPFYMIDDRSGRNSFKKERVDMFLENNPDFSLQKTENIKIRTLSDIMDEIGEIPDYMSIDIEGMEYEVLSHYDLKNCGPIVITLEVMRGNVEYGRKVIEMMESTGYFMYFKIYSNVTFIREKYREQVYML